MLAPTTQQTRIMDWMRRQITAEACVSVSDITSMYTVLCVVGPKSKEMLSLMCNTDLNFYGHMAKVSAGGIGKWGRPHTFPHDIFQNCNRDL